MRRLLRDCAGGRPGGRDLAELRAHRADRRAKTVLLTAEGAKAKPEVESGLRHPPAAFSALAEAEQEQLRVLLRRVADADERLASPSTVP